MDSSRTTTVHRAAVLVMLLDEVLELRIRLVGDAGNLRFERLELFEVEQFGANVQGHLQRVLGEGEVRVVEVRIQLRDLEQQVAAECDRFAIEQIAEEEDAL